MAHVKKEMISFFLTNECNLNCRYCYTNKSEFIPQTLPFEFAKIGIDDFFDNTDCRHIRFFGAGEPTLKFNLMKQIYDYAHEKAGDKLSVEIQTNGVFSKNVAEWLANNVDIIWISWDGTPKIQNFYRPSKGGKRTSEIVERNARFLLKNGKGMTGARTTIGSFNLYKQKEIINYFANLGIKNVWADPIIPAVGKEALEKNIDLMEYSKEFLKAKELADKLGVFYGSQLTCNFDEKTFYNCRACLPMPHLTTDGYVSACDMASFGESNGPMSIFIYGKWDKENNKIIYDKEKIDRLRSRSATNMAGCRGCEIIDHCAGYCLGEVVNETGNLFGKKEYICEPIRFLAKNMPLNKGRYKYLHS